MKNMFKIYKLLFFKYIYITYIYIFMTVFRVKLDGRFSCPIRQALGLHLFLHLGSPGSRGEWRVASKSWENHGETTGNTVIAMINGVNG
jgi:hypothetical protein